MSFILALSPDIDPVHMPQWFVFNNYIQKFLDAPCRLEPFESSSALQTALEAGEVDIIYASAYDTAHLVREKEFIPVARGINHADEVIVCSHSQSPIQKISNLTAPLRIAATSFRDVEMIGYLLLEPADIRLDDMEIVRVSNYVTMTRTLMDGQADLGFFLKRSYDKFSELVTRELTPLIDSKIDVIHHSLLISPKLSDQREHLLQCLQKMKNQPTTDSLLAEMGIDEGWEESGPEDAEFMIDMMETLSYHGEEV